MMSSTNYPKLIPATLADYPTIQNLARFYVYDMSRTCGLNSKDWEVPADGLYESFDFKKYFFEPERLAYLVRMNDEIAGFALIYQIENVWHMGEFFILARFQNRKIAQAVAKNLWEKHPGQWEVTIIPENQPARHFWKKVISLYGTNITEGIKIIERDSDQPKRILYTFHTKKAEQHRDQQHIRSGTDHDIEAMVNLSKEKRLYYEQAQPQFWRHAPDAEEQQTQWFNDLLSRDDYLVLVSECDQHITGFIIGRLRKAPEVYAPGGLTLEVDDFCVQNSQWDEQGILLLNKMKMLAKDKGAVQMIVVCGAHDIHKKRFLKNSGLTIASEWFTGSL